MRILPNDREPMGEGYDRTMARPLGTALLQREAKPVHKWAERRFVLASSPTRGSYPNFWGIRSVALAVGKQRCQLYAPLLALVKPLGVAVYLLHLVERRAGSHQVVLD